jgi:hypothetical protein
MFFRLFMELVLSAEVPPQPPLAAQRRPERLAISRAAIPLRDPAARRCTIRGQALGRVVRSAKGFLLAELPNNEVSLLLARSTKLLRQRERVEALIRTISSESGLNTRQVKWFLKLAVHDICSIEILKSVPRCAVFKIRFQMVNFWGVLKLSFFPPKGGLILKALRSLLKYKHIAGPKSE